MIYREHYQIPDEPGSWAHLDHCLEGVRLAIMCKADYSLITYDWLPTFPRPWGNWAIEEECIDWEKLDAWAGERSFSIFDQKSLVHPELGLSFPIVKESEVAAHTPHASAEDIEALALGTNPKGNWGP
jgi:hypothetical protein